MPQLNPTIAALTLSASLTGTGLLHFVRPETFDGIVPTALPGNARTWTLLSGAAELACAAALAVPRTRPLGGALAAALFVAVFPANLKMARGALRSRRATTSRRAIAVVRLPFQVPLVLLALRARRG